MNKERLLEALYGLSKTVEHEEHNAHEANGIDRAIRVVEEFQDTTLHERQDKAGPVTRAEKIRCMTDRELAELISSGEWSTICPYCRYYHTGQCKYDEEGNLVGDGETCVKGAMEWLH